MAATILKAAKEDVLKLMIECGLKGAAEYPLATLEKRINKSLQKTIEETGIEPTSPESKNLLADMLQTLKEGGAIKVIESTAKSEPKKKKKKPKADKAASDEPTDEIVPLKPEKTKKTKAHTENGRPASKPKHKKLPLDKFGCRPGSKNHFIMAVMSRQFQTMSELMTKAGQDPSSTCFDLMSKMIERGIVERGGSSGKELRLIK